MSRTGSINRIIISRTDSIGDVILTLPVAGVLKKQMPEVQIIFLGRSYTREVVNCCVHIDEFIDWGIIQKKTREEQINIFQSLQADAIVHVFPVKDIALLARKAGIPLRFGTSNRLYHWFSCNRLIRLSRKNSHLHEAQLNFRLLKDLGVKEHYSLDEIHSFYGFEKVEPNRKLNQYLYKDKYNLILHPKSKGSAREWGLENFRKLVRILPENRFNILISGTKEEGERTGDAFDQFEHVKKLTGEFNLKEFIQLIGQSDALVAASTGPLHIAAALGKTCIGIYPPIRPMHPGRWAPVGKNAHFLVLDKKCSKCRVDQNCECIRNITPEMVKQKLMEVGF